YQIHGVFCRDGVLHCCLDTRYAAHRIRVPLAEALTPESICLTYGQYGLSDHTVQRKQTWVPTNGDDGSVLVGACYPVDLLEIFGDTRMGVKTIHDIEMLSPLWSLDR